jgi:hypothetical protein
MFTCTATAAHRCRKDFMKLQDYRVWKRLSAQGCPLDVLKLQNASPLRVYQQDVVPNLIYSKEGTAVVIPLRITASETCTIANWNLVCAGVGFVWWLPECPYHAERVCLHECDHGYLRSLHADTLQFRVLERGRIAKGASISGVLFGTGRSYATPTPQYDVPAKLVLEDVRRQRYRFDLTLSWAVKWPLKTPLPLERWERACLVPRRSKT